MTKPAHHASSKGSSKTVFLVIGIVACIVLAFGAFAAFVFTRRAGPPGSDLTAKRFLTDKIQADKKTDAVIFSSGVREQPGFMQQVEVTKQVARNGGYTGEPQLVRPKRFSSSFQDEVVYKICRVDNQRCLYFWIETKSNTRGAVGVGASGKKGSKSDVVSFMVYESEAEAVARYDN